MAVKDVERVKLLMNQASQNLTEALNELAKLPLNLREELKNAQDKLATSATGIKDASKDLEAARSKFGLGGKQ